MQTQSEIFFVEIIHVQLGEEAKFNLFVEMVLNLLNHLLAPVIEVSGTPGSILGVKITCAGGKHLKDRISKTGYQKNLRRTFLRNLKGNLHCLLLLAIHFTPWTPRLGSCGSDTGGATWKANDLNVDDCDVDDDG